MTAAVKKLLPLALLALAAGINLLLLALVQQLTRHESRAVLPPAAAFPLELLQLPQRPVAPPPVAESPPPQRPSKPPPPPVPAPPQPAAELSLRALPAQPLPSPGSPALELPRLRAAGSPYLPAAATPPPAPATPLGPSLVPAIRVEPVYPAYALSAGLEGEVTVEFLVTPEGRVTELRVVSAVPPQVFERAVLQAMRSWRFDPGNLGGQSRRMQQEFLFRLQD
ncbi:MAG: TonB family protein [Gammaproteobacteria bacterium]|nr:TonB family protein [Gammaproteobacteria bacterium]